MKYQHKILQETQTYQGFFRVFRYQVEIDYYDGSKSPVLERECIGKGSQVVAALPYDPIAQKIILVEQFRIGAMVAGDFPWVKEIVAGFMDKAHESPEQALQRELEEEIGCPAQSLHPLFSFYGSPGGSAGKTHLYLARIDSQKITPYTGLKEEGEDIRVLSMSYPQAQQLLWDKQANNAMLIMALQAFFSRPPQE